MEQRAAGNALVSVVFLARDAKLHQREHIISHHYFTACVLGEIDDQIGSFSGCQREALYLDRMGQQTLIGSDLIDGRSVRQPLSGRSVHSRRSVL